VPILVKIDQEMRSRVLVDGCTDTLTDANRFYNLSHAISYSYGTDKNCVLHSIRQHEVLYYQNQRYFNQSINQS